MLRFSVFLLFLLIKTICFTQTKTDFSDSIQLKKYYFIDANLHSGLVINNYIYWDSFPSRNPSALLEIKFGKQTIGAKTWQQHYGFPQVGLSLIAGYLGNNTELGYTVGLVPNITINTQSENNWSLKITLGLGFSYFNKPYDSKTNKTNILIGSHLTNMSIAQLYFRRKLTDRTDFNFGISAIHASDGHAQLPNVGLNMVTANIGLKYYLIKRPDVFYRDTSHRSQIKQLKFGTRAGMGLHEFGNELGPVDGPKYPVYDFAVYASKPAGKLGSAILGLGYKYYASFYEKIIQDSIYQTDLHLKSSVITLFLAYEFKMGRVSLLAQGGLNIYHPFWKKFTELIDEKWTFYKQIEGLISTRLGLQYYILDPQLNNKNLFLGLYIKANMGGADFVSLSTGFEF